MFFKYMFTWLEAGFKLKPCMHAKKKVHSRHQVPPAEHAEPHPSTAPSYIGVVTSYKMKPRLLLITLTSPSTPLLKYVKANCSVKPSIRMKPNPMHRGLVPEKGESDLLPNELKVAWSRKAAMKGDVRS